MKQLAIAMCLVLAGCGERMPDDQIIAQVKKCKSADLAAQEWQNWKYEVISIQCRQKIYW